MHAFLLHTQQQQVLQQCDMIGLVFEFSEEGSSITTASPAQRETHISQSAGYSFSHLSQRAGSILLDALYRLLQLEER